MVVSNPNAHKMLLWSGAPSPSVFPPAPCLLVDTCQACYSVNARLFVPCKQSFRLQRLWNGSLTELALLSPCVSLLPGVSGLIYLPSFSYFSMSQINFSARASTTPVALFCCTSLYSVLASLLGSCCPTACGLCGFSRDPCSTQTCLLTLASCFCDCTDPSHNACCHSNCCHNDSCCHLMPAGNWGVHLTIPKWAFTDVSDTQTPYVPLTVTGGSNLLNETMAAVANANVATAG